MDREYVTCLLFVCLTRRYPTFIYNLKVFCIAEWYKCNSYSKLTAILNMLMKFSYEAARLQQEQLELFQHLGSAGIGSSNSRRRRKAWRSFHLLWLWIKRHVLQELLTILSVLPLHPLLHLLSIHLLLNRWLEEVLMWALDVPHRSQNISPWGHCAEIKNVTTLMQNVLTWTTREEHCNEYSIRKNSI